MNQRRRGDVVGLAQQPLNANPIIGRMGIGIGATSGEKHHPATQTKPDCADFGAAIGAQIINRGLQIANPFIAIIAVHQGKCLLPFGF